MLFYNNALFSLDKALAVVLLFGVTSRYGAGLNRKQLQEKLIYLRIIDKITGCWFHWKDNKRNIYYRIYINGENLGAHRWAAIAFLGCDEFNKDTEICHINECSSPACFNPEHIYIGNHSTNRKDHWNTKRKSEKHCIHGHERIEKNGKLICVECRKQYRANEISKIHKAMERHTQSCH